MPDADRREYTVWLCEQKVRWCVVYVRTFGRVLDHDG
jgi:hypothetical protein